MTEIINELYLMCQDNDFSMSRAMELVCGMDVNQPFDDPKYKGNLTTFLSAACLHTNLRMAKLLLENGADPNYILYADRPGWQENPFWDLQYCVYSEDFYKITGNLLLSVIFLFNFSILYL